MPEIHPQPDGSFYIDGTALIRDVNRAMGWHRVEGLEHLEFIPESNLCLKIDSYLLETLQIKDNMIHTVKIQPIGD